MPVRRRARATVVPSRGINIQLQTCSRIVVNFCYIYLFACGFGHRPHNHWILTPLPFLNHGIYLIILFITFTHVFIPIRETFPYL